MGGGLDQDRNSEAMVDLTRLTFNQCAYVKNKRSLVAPDGGETRLRAKTCKVFELLAAHPNEVISRDYLVETVWGDVIVTDDTLNQSIREIRKALGDDERKALETLPRQGYLLHATEISPDVVKTRRSSTVAVALAAAMILLGGLYLLVPRFFHQQPKDLAMHEGSYEANNQARLENLKVKVGLAGSKAGETGDRLARAVVTELARYSNIEPIQTNSEIPDYKLELSLLDDDAQLINLQLIHAASDDLVLAENFKYGNKEVSTLAARVAALVGSPAGGAIGHHLMKVSGSKLVEELSRPECLAHGYGCTSCSGEFDSVTPRAVQCLANLLEDDPKDPDAWALQSTVYSRQYLWGSSLSEPMRSDKTKRTYLQAKSVEAATRAEAEANGNNPSVYWGMTQAYLASCDADKMRAAIDEGLKLNPGDPNMLAVYGNFLSYAGKWDEGKAMIEKALSLEPRFFEKWWYMALAKWHYRKGEYQEAYDIFVKSFNERNWLSHLQMAYTLPHLGRIDEAKRALQGFMRVAPSMTREHVYEFYRSYCFQDEFLNRVKTAFDLIDMPSRGSGDDFQNILPVRATVERIGDRMVEYVDVGNGIPFVFVHGSFSDYRTWGYMMIPVSETNRFISYTLRHFGTQPWPSETADFDFNKDEGDLIDFIEHLNVGAVVLVGWSRGVQPAAMVARKRPDLVSKLVLYEGTITGLDSNKGPEIKETPQKIRQMEEMQNAAAKGDFREAVKPLFEIALQYPPNTFEIQPTALKQVVLDNARTLTQIFSEQPPHQPEFNCNFFAEIQTPSLVVYGENTNPWWKFESETMAGCMPNAKLSVLKKASHDGPLSRPQALTEMIERFVAR